MRNLLILITLCALSLPKISYASELSECKGSPANVDDLNKDTYAQSWKNCHGEATYLRSKNRYVGEYKDGKKHGYGTYTWADGSQYVGEYKDDNRHGQGTLTPTNGDKYVGQYKDGKKYGYGTYTFTSGEKYVGGFKGGKMNGQGTYTWADGEKYVGEFKDDNRHGQGTNTWANGSQYVGEYKDDNRHGKGVIKNNFSEQITRVSCKGGNCKELAQIISVEDVILDTKLLQGKKFIMMGQFFNSGTDHGLMARSLYSMGASIWVQYKNASRPDRKKLLNCSMGCSIALEGIFEDDRFYLLRIVPKDEL